MYNGGKKLLKVVLEEYIYKFCIIHFTLKTILNMVGKEYG